MTPEKPPLWIDSHCHLNHARNGEGDTPQTLVERANKAGVGGMLTICCEIESEFSSLLDTVKPLENIWCTVGTHPHDAGLEAEKNITKDDIVRLAQSHDKVIGIGESGLDYFYNHSTPEDQAASFRKHIQACIETNLPLVVHARDADTDIIRIIREENAKAGQKVRGVMHCFSSGPQLAKDALEEGFYISFSGIVKFKKSTALQDIAKTVPLDRILVETDAPFLAPEPHRGKTNEPAYVVHTGKYLSNLLGINETDFAKRTRDNFFTLFDKAQKTWTQN
jgi:TatD DNase family protein